MKAQITEINLNTEEQTTTYHLSSVDEQPPHVLFVVKIDQNLKAIAGFTVGFVSAWGDNGEPLDTEDSMSGSIKWDGCTDIEINRHLCGGERVADLQFMLWWVWSQLPKILPSFDPDTADWSDDGIPLALGQVFSWPS